MQTVREPSRLPADRYQRHVVGRSGSRIRESAMFLHTINDELHWQATKARHDAFIRQATDYRLASAARGSALTRADRLCRAMGSVLIVLGQRLQSTPRGRERAATHAASSVASFRLAR